MDSFESSDGGGTSPTAPRSAPEPAARWEDFGDIFYNPSAVFARREKGSAAIPIVVVAISLGLLFIANQGVLEPIMNAEMRRAMAAIGERSSGSEETMVVAGNFGGDLGVIFAVIGTVVFTPIAITLLGFVLWLVGKIVGAAQTLGAAIVVAAYSSMPRILEAILAGVQGMLMDPSQLTGRYEISLSAARFLDPASASPMLLALLGRFDVFVIWITVLLAIGLSVTGRISRGQAAIAGILVWTIGTAFAALGAAIMSLAR